MTENEYDDWLSKHKKAELSIHNRDELLQESYSRMECDMELLGATGIEDRLQDGVPDAIATLRNAGIKVWVLTGDKQVQACASMYVFVRIVLCYLYRDELSTTCFCLCKFSSDHLPKS